MTEADIDGDGLATALIQISAHAERISALDAREAAHYENLADRLRDIASQLADVTEQSGEIGTTLARHHAILASLDGLDAQVASLAAHLTDLADSEEESNADRYQPVPPPRWWQLTGSERETALDRLRAWVEQAYRPGYGQLAAALPAMPIEAARATNRGSGAQCAALYLARTSAGIRPRLEIWMPWSRAHARTSDWSCLDDWVPRACRREDRTLRAAAM